MTKSHRILKSLLWKLIVPCFTVFVVLVLTFNVINEFSHIGRLRGEVRKFRNELNEKRIKELELRREKVIIEMLDYQVSIAKANGQSLDPGEQRIVVK